MLRASVKVASAGTPSVVGAYVQRDPLVIPTGFAKVCEEMRWNTAEQWQTLSDQKRPWFEAPNGAYMYFNKGDGHWWIDEPSGGGVYVASADTQLPPASGWKALQGAMSPLPELSVVQF
jgi:hypothetical protein